MAEAGGADELRAGPGLRHRNAFLDGDVTVVLVVDHQARHVELACQDFGGKALPKIGAELRLEFSVEYFLHPGCDIQCGEKLLREAAHIVRRADGHDAVHLEPLLHGVDRTGDAEGMPDDRVHRPAGPGHGLDGLADFRQVGGASRRAAVCRRIERHHPEAGADQLRCERAELRAATVPAVHHQHRRPRAPGIDRKPPAAMDHGLRLGRAAPFLLLRRFGKTQRLKPQAIHPAPGQCRRDQAKQANLPCAASRRLLARVGNGMGLVVHDRALWSRGRKPFGSELTLAFTHTPVFSTTLQSPLLDA